MDIKEKHAQIIIKEPGEIRESTHDGPLQQIDIFPLLVSITQSKITENILISTNTYLQSIPFYSSEDPFMLLIDKFDDSIKKSEYQKFWCNFLATLSLYCGDFYHQTAFYNHIEELLLSNLLQIDNIILIFAVYGKTLKCTSIVNIIPESLVIALIDRISIDQMQKLLIIFVLL